MDIGFDLARLQTQHLLIELAGVFWLVAELILLHFILLGREHIEQRPHSATLQPTRAARRRALLFIAITVGLVALVLVRRALPLPEDRPEAVYAYVRAHLVVWAAFVTGWVVLEALMVYHGWRGYRCLRRLLHAPSAPNATPPRALLLLLGLPGLLAASTLAWADIAHPQHDLSPLRNAVYLYLRIAGVAWITLEWYAAWILWRSWGLLPDRRATP